MPSCLEWKDHDLNPHIHLNPPQIHLTVLYSKKTKMTKKLKCLRRIRNDISIPQAKHNGK